MKPKLPRALLWKDKNTIDEILKEPFGGQLYHMLMAMSRNMSMPFALEMHLTILNEVFYQCTRVTYEKDPDAMVRNYSTDIKANVGGLQMTTRMVLMLMMYLLMAQSDRSDEVQTFIGRLRLYYKTPKQYDLDLHAEECFLSSFPYAKGDEGFFLIPEPCPADDLEGMVIDWQEVTRGYSKQMIRNVLLLWRNTREEKKVLGMIEQSFHKRALTLFKDDPEDVADDEFFSVYRSELGADNEDEGPVCESCGAPIVNRLEESESLTELELKLNLFEKRNAELETENVRLKSELNNHRQRSKRDRAFTLKMIVDYCKNQVELRQVEGIIKMLNVFLRNGAKDDEYELVDSIEEEFKKRKYGDTVSGGKNSMGDYSNMVNFVLPPNTDYDKLFAALPKEIKEMWRKQLIQKDNG